MRDYQHNTEEDKSCKSAEQDYDEKFEKSDCGDSLKEIKVDRLRDMIGTEHFRSHNQD